MSCYYPFNDNYCTRTLWRRVFIHRFTQYCGNAYLKLRKHAQLFLTLFAMMLHGGIPELQSVTDLEYLRTTLALERTDEEALK